MQWLLDRFAAADPSLKAFVHKGQVFTYGQMSARIAEFTAELRERGIRAGQTVVVLADYAPDVYCMILALASLKALVVPMTRGSVIEEGEALASWFDVTQTDAVRLDAPGHIVPADVDSDGFFYARFQKR